MCRSRTRGEEAQFWGGPSCYSVIHYSAPMRPPEEVRAFGERVRTRIEAKYASLGYDQGWRLLYSPLDVLSGSAPAAFIGLNPGGLLENSEGHGELATPTSLSAYRDEVWKPPRAAGEERLQQQALAVFDRLNVLPEAVLAGNLVPFRSRDWERLENRAEAFTFGQQLWADIFAWTGTPAVVVTMGKPVFAGVADILDAHSVQHVPYGWGSESASRARFEGGRLIGLPHLWGDRSCCTGRGGRPRTNCSSRQHAQCAPSGIE